jgi:hypothetical protein
MESSDRSGLRTRKREFDISLMRSGVEMLFQVPKGLPVVGKEARVFG